MTPISVPAQTLGRVCRAYKNDPSKGVDDRDTITEICIKFLTDHVVETKDDMQPAFVRYEASASTADNSNLRKFLKAWFPALKDEDFKRFDADKLIGKGASHYRGAYGQQEEREGIREGGGRDEAPGRVGPADGAA